MDRESENETNMDVCGADSPDSPEVRLYDEVVDESGSGRTHETEISYSRLPEMIDLELRKCGNSPPITLGKLGL
jgi:hypothetical protein